MYDPTIAWLIKGHHQRAAVATVLALVSAACYSWSVVDFDGSSTALAFEGIMAACTAMFLSLVMVERDGARSLIRAGGRHYEP